MILKIAAQHAQGKTPLFFFTDKQNGTFNMFDFGIVAVSYVFIVSGVNGGSLITVLRLLRLLKIATRMPQLRTILLGLVAGVTAVGSILVLLSLITYLFAIVAVLLFGENDPGHFGRVGQAMLTLFQCATLAAWRDIFLVNYFGCDKYDMDLYTETTHPSKIHTELGWFYAFNCSEPRHDRRFVATIFFMFFTVLTAFVVLSLFISVITMAMFEIMEMKAHEKKVLHIFQDGRMPTEKRQAMHKAFTDSSTELGEAISFVFDTAATAKQTSRYKRCKKYATACCRKVSLHPAFQTTVVGAIMLTGVLEGIETDTIADQRMRHAAIEDTPWIKTVNDIILCLFTCELVVNFIAVSRPAKFFRDGWNIFDTLVIGLTYLSMFSAISSVTVLRLLRLLRVVRLLHSFPTLQSVAQSLINAFRNVGFVMLMILIVNFIFAAIGMIMFDKNDPQNFGTLNLAMVSARTLFVPFMAILTCCGFVSCVSTFPR